MLKKHTGVLSVFRAEGVVGMLVSGVCLEKRVLHGTRPIYLVTYPLALVGIL